jgi:hypothetical protein
MIKRLLTLDIFNILISDTNFMSVVQNILSLRELGNKLHGDNLEIAISHLISEKTKYSSIHIGKEFFRSGWDFDIIVSDSDYNVNAYVELMRNIKEDDVERIKLLCIKYNIKYTNKKNSKKLLTDILKKELYNFEDKVEHLSLKCYGKGPLQLSTNSDGGLIDNCFNYVIDKEKEQQIPLDVLLSEPFNDILTDNVLSIIYDEEHKTFSIMLIQLSTLIQKVKDIIYYPRIQKNKSFTYPIFKFYDENKNYLFEVRYGKKDNNALQRGLWTKIEDKKNDSFYYICFDEVYKINPEWLRKYKDFLIS